MKKIGRYRPYTMSMDLPSWHPVPVDPRIAYKYQKSSLLWYDVPIPAKECEIHVQMPDFLHGSLVNSLTLIIEPFFDGPRPDQSLNQNGVLLYREGQLRCPIDGTNSSGYFPTEYTFTHKKIRGDRMYYVGLLYQLMPEIFTEIDSMATGRWTYAGNHFFFKNSNDATMAAFMVASQ